MDAMEVIGLGFVLFIVVVSIAVGIFAWGYGDRYIAKNYTYKPQKPPRTCCMCDRTLKKEHESKTWKGAHEWCERYY